LIFLDACGLNLTMTRTPARAPSGERVQGTAPFHPGGNLSVIRALGGHGVCAPRLSEGAVNSEVLTLYVEQLLAPCWRPGPRVLLDHGKFPYAPKALELREATGARVEQLPAYSPDFNPLAGCIAKLKTALRTFKARTQRKLTHALAKALALVTEADIRGWFEHCGYVFSLN
jgi:transposase